MPPCIPPTIDGGLAPPRREAVVGAKSTAKPSYSVSEVALHNRRGDAWLIYKGQVLDVSKWISSHPGGEQTILRFAGMDATDEIRAFHDDWVLEKRVPGLVVGTVKGAPEATELVRDFRELGEEFEKLGYFHVSPWFYVRKVAFVMSMFAIALGLLFKSESFASHMASAVVLGMFWQQFAFVGHDCGHMSARTHARDHIDVPKLGALVTFFNGISVAWWKATHNVHHAVPNTVDCDPDIAHLPVFAVDKLMFGSLFNKYHGRVMEFDWPARNIFVPFQHLWYYPIMCVARFNLYIQSILFLLSSGDGHGGRTKLDVAAFLGFGGWLSLLVSFIPTWGERVAYVMLSHAVAGLLNVQITLSHFSRPIFDSPTKLDGPDRYGGDFFTRNVVSSLDVDCTPSMDWFHGGLQFQTLHHLYPRIGREHLRKTGPLIASLCKKHGLPYSRKSFLACNMEVFETLKSTAVHSRTWSPLIYESMCAQG
ncbi:hypothetical protein ACHAXT_007167 [Thalassiosira profunda]